MAVSDPCYFPGCKENSMCGRLTRNRRNCTCDFGFYVLDRNYTVRSMLLNDEEEFVGCAGTIF